MELLRGSGRLLGVAMAMLVLSAASTRAFLVASGFRKMAGIHGFPAYSKGRPFTVPDDAGPDIGGRLICIKAGGLETEDEEIEYHSRRALREYHCSSAAGFSSPCSSVKVG